MSDDDDTGGGKKKLAIQVEAASNKPITLKLWVVAAIVVAACVLGALVF